MEQRPLRMDGEGSSGSADPRRQEGMYEEREFARRFNGLMNALADFASSYTLAT